MVLLLTGALVATGSAGALIGEPVDAAGLTPDAAGLDPGTGPLGGEPLRFGGLLADPEGLDQWLEWSAHAPLGAVEAEAREGAPQSGQGILPSPDRFPGHEHADESEQREAWRAWRLATEIAALRVPNAPLASGNNEAMQENGDGNGSGDAEPPSGSPVGKPHSLDRLWRLQTHGEPRILLPADDNEATYLVTQRGVLFLPEADSDPEWMLHLEGVAGHAATTKGEGRKDLVIGMHDIYRDAVTPSIWVVSGDEEKIQFSGLRGERALLYWDLTDVDGDGEDDILGVDKSGNITAIRLDGEEIYREPIPKADLPEEEGDEVPEDPFGLFGEFALLALARTGGQALGDGNDDGVLDVFTTSWYGLLEAPQVIVVSMIDGETGKIEWSQPIEPDPDPFKSRFTMPVLTGDVNGDGYDDVDVFEAGWGWLGNYAKNHYLSGDDGRLLARDGEQFPMCCDPFTGEPLTPAPYMPLALVDLNGDGEQQILGIDVVWADYWENQWYIEVNLNLQLRSVLDIAGAPTVLDESYAINQYYGWRVALRTLQYGVHTQDGKDQFVLLIPDHATPTDEGPKLVTLDENGLDTKNPSQPVGHYTVNPQTGQGYAWTLNDDRWRPVDADLAPTGNGTRLIMGAYPIARNDHDKDGTPDFLIQRSMGYFWISGRTGEVIDSLSRPLGARLVASSTSDDRYVLERDDDHYILYDTHEGTTRWTVNRDAGGESASVRGLADYTADGENEILFRAFDYDDNWNPVETWSVYSGTLPGKVWDTTTEYGSSRVDDILPARNGTEILLIDDADSATEVALWAVGDEDGSARAWSAEYGYIDAVATGKGTVALLEDGNEGLRLIALAAEDGETVHTQGIDSDQDVRWIRVVETPRGHNLLVYSFTTDNPDEEHGKHQYVSVIDLQKGEQTTTFQISDPIVHVIVHDFGLGGGYQEVRVQVSWPGPDMGDWTGDRVPELALSERNWPVIRSLKDGDIVAVGPTHGSFTFTEDLNGDGREEVGLNTGGSLRMYAFDTTGGLLDAEDPLARIQTNDTHGADNESLERFFGGDEKKSPGPGVLVVVLLTLLGALAARARSPRGDRP